MSFRRPRCLALGEDTSVAVPDGAGAETAHAKLPIGVFSGSLERGMVDADTESAPKRRCWMAEESPPRHGRVG